MKILRGRKGITLIALVITIIVLLILAGVAISMLSGENGILKKAADAKQKTEVAQKQEETTLVDYELISHFTLNNSKYKCKYGFITGITVEGDAVTETVESLQNALPKGYTIIGEGITKDTKLRTGIEIKKDGVTVAYTVVYGDVNCDGTITILDVSEISNRLKSVLKTKLQKYQMAAGDLNRDGEITMADADIIQNRHIGGPKIYQNKEAINPTMYTVEELENKYREAFKEKLEKVEDAEYTIGYEDYDGSMEPKLMGVDKQTKIGTILDIDENISILDENNEVCGRDDYFGGNEYAVICNYKDGRELIICYIWNI